MDQLADALAKAKPPKPRTPKKSPAANRVTVSSAGGAVLRHASTKQRIAKPGDKPAVTYPDGAAIAARALSGLATQAEQDIAALSAIIADMQVAASIPPSAPRNGIPSARSYLPRARFVTRVLAAAIAGNHAPSPPSGTVENTQAPRRMEFNTKDERLKASDARRRQKEELGTALGQRPKLVKALDKRKGGADLMDTRLRLPGSFEGGKRR